MRHKIILIVLTLVVCTVAIPAQERTPSLNSTRVVTDGHASAIRLAQHFTTTIRLPEPVSSVVVGDSALFQAEHTPNEPLSVFVRPMSSSGESNLVISTVSGRQFALVLRSGSDGFDSLVVCRMSGPAFIEETYPSSLIAETMTLDASHPKASGAKPVETDPLELLLSQQKARPQSAPVGQGLTVDIGRVLDLDSRFVVLFSVVNNTEALVELMPPQIQLAGQVRSGLFGRNAKWTTVDQIPVDDFRLTQRRLSRGARADGLLVFERPALKQSNESLLLQIAEAARVDHPVLVPIKFSADRKLEEGK